MNAFRWSLLVVAMSIVLPAAAQDDWTGKRVVLKRPGIRIGYSDDSGTQVYVAELTNLSYAVIAENQGFLRVRHRGDSGWFPKSDALLPDEAIPYFAERVRLAPAKDSFPHAYLGWAHRELKQYDLALAAYDKAIQREPKADWYNNRGVIHVDVKKYDLAVADFSEAIKRAPKFVVAYENRASALMALGKLGPALDDWNETLRQDPRNGPARIRRAKIFLDRKEFAKAIEDLSEVVKDDPKNAAVRVERGQVYVDLGKTDEAIADFSAALEADPKNAEAWLARSQLYVDKKEYVKARVDADEALRLSPNFADARVARGWTLFLLGEFAKANDDFAAALKLNPKHPGAHNSQAWLWATCPDKKFRDGKKAVDFAEKAVALSGGKDPATLDTHAAALAEAGRFDEAIRLQEQVVRSTASTPLAAETAARLELYRKKQPYRQSIGQ